LAGRKQNLVLSWPTNPRQIFDPPCWATASNKNKWARLAPPLYSPSFPVPELPCAMRDPRLAKRPAVEPVLVELAMEGEWADDTDVRVGVRSVIHESAGRKDMMLWVEARRRRDTGT